MIRDCKRTKQKAMLAPPHLLMGEGSSQPRSSLRSFSNAQDNQKTRAAHTLVREQQRNSARAILRRHLQKEKDQDHVGDDRVYDDIYRDIDDGFGPDSGSDSETVPMTVVPDKGGQSEWEDVELSAEEKLLYSEAKEAYHSYDFKDYRNRRDKVQIDQRRWDKQMRHLVDAYIDYCYRRRCGGVCQAEIGEYHTVQVLDIFSYEEQLVARYKHDEYNNSSYIRQGFIPFNPLLNKSMVTLQTVELYHHLFLRCPRLGIQSFVKTLCDLRGVAFKNYLAIQFSSAYDVYVRILNEARGHIQDLLGRGSANWRMLNTCPCCQYEVHGEKQLPIRMLIAVDGNNSLKRMERREAAAEGDTLGASKERADDREVVGDYFLPQAEVDRWDESKWHTHEGFTPTRKQGKKVPCADRFSNMNERKTKKEYGVFDATGVFVGCCRHRFTLKVLDMMRSGEQSKYVLAFLNHFLTACREDRRARGLPEDPQGNIGVGYDISCNLIDMISRNPLGNLASQEKLQMLIGLLHAYGHNRLCQLLFLLIYVYGGGNEDLEVCERFFSQSNALAPVTRYQSRFHRHQSISEYCYHQDNFEAYANLSKFLYGNYKQALEILATLPVVVKGMKENGITRMEVFREWLEEERQYLESRKLTPEYDIFVMDYYNKLKDLESCEAVLSSAKKTLRMEIWDPTMAGISARTDEQVDALKKDAEIRRCQERRLVLLEDLSLLESRLGVKTRWKKDSEEWKKAEKMVRDHRYQKALDKLEGLIVARMFELSRLNLAGTGYKMRQHIGKAMKNRSVTIKKALQEYNEAAVLLQPPRPPLEWKDVIGYSYLSEFDFLRDTRSDVREKPWAKPALRQLMTQAFKLLRSEEELDRLHVEIQRLVTYMKEEATYLQEMQNSVYQTDPALAYQIHLYANERSRFNGLHRSRLKQITKLPRFNHQNAEYFQPGVGVRRQTLSQEGLRDGNDDLDEEDDDDDDIEAEEQEADAATQAVLGIADNTR